MDKQISAVEASISQKDEAVVLLDVREDSELAICRIEGALHIPLGEIPDRYDSLPRDRTIIAFCHHGMRSANVQRFLISKGFDNIINMQGGIHAWSTDVDPQTPTY
ncbi:MAG: rhodanese-related sulfurtransferase [Lentimonas sp.]|jgi:rhodanese-related sulfurtransferase